MPDFNPAAVWAIRLSRLLGQQKWKSWCASTEATSTKAGTGFGEDSWPMDKGTVRGMIGAQVFNVEVRTEPVTPSPSFPLKAWIWMRSSTPAIYSA